jgi:hypothetical protein
MISAVKCWLMSRALLFALAACLYWLIHADDRRPPCA